jgi:hypothetical protein
MNNGEQLPVIPIGTNSRIDRARREIIEILKREDLLIAVRSLDISDGTVRPVVEIVERPQEDAKTNRR